MIFTDAQTIGFIIYNSVGGQSAARQILRDYMRADDIRPYHVKIGAIKTDYEYKNKKLLYKLTSVIV